MSIPRTATSDLVDLAQQALLEMPPLEVGFFLRDLGVNFPCTMDAIKKARKRMSLLVKTIKDHKEIESIASFSQPMGPGFNRSQINKAKKLEIIEIARESKFPRTRYVLRGDLNKVIAQAVVQRQNMP